MHYFGIPVFHSQGKFVDNPALIIGFVGMVGGMLMILFSLNKRNQVRVAKGIDHMRKTFEDDCMCCKCKNCDRNHNHWTHD